MATPNIVPRAEGEGGLGTAAKGWGGLFITNTTADSSTQGGKIVLAGNDGAAMQSGSRLGVIEFQGAESASALTTGARIEAITEAVWSGSENGTSLKFYTTDGDASQSEVLTLDSNNLATFSGYIKGPTDDDFKITSDGKLIFDIDSDNDETSQEFSFMNHGAEIVSIQDTGHIISSGPITGVNYRTIWIDAGGMVPSATAGAVAYTQEMHATNFTTLDYLSFGNSSETYADFKLVMPEQYNGGTVKVKFYWRPADAEASVSVVWGIKAYAATDSDALTGASGGWGTAVTVEDASLNTADDLHISPATGAMTIAGSPAEGKLVFFRVFRKTADANDDYADEAELLGVNIQYTEDGSTASNAW